MTLPVLLFPLSVTFHHCHVASFIYMLVVKDKRAEPGNLPDSNGIPKIGDHWIRKYTSFSLQILSRTPKGADIKTDWLTGLQPKRDADSDFVFGGLKDRGAIR